MNTTQYDIKDYQGKFKEVWGVESESKPGLIYTVALNHKDQWSCGCPRWTRNASRPECKHIKHIRAIRAGARIVLRLEEMPDQVRKKLSTFAAIEI